VEAFLAGADNRIGPATGFDGFVEAFVTLVAGFSTFVARGVRTTRAVDLAGAFTAVRAVDDAVFVFATRGSFTALAVDVVLAARVLAGAFVARAGLAGALATRLTLLLTI